MGVLTLFPTNRAVPHSDATEERLRTSEKMRDLLLDREHTSEVYGPYGYSDVDKPANLMPTDDELVNTWGKGNYKIYDEMGRNVLQYRALHDGRIDVVTGLTFAILPGKKGDPDSEAAAEEVRSHWENFEERMIAMKAAGRFIERGFAALENVYGESTRGASKGQLSIVAMIDRPESWFAFDWLNRPYFKKVRYSSDPQAIAPFKVTFGRYGSLNKPYGRGIGQDDYPSVWTIDAVNKGHYAAVERWGYLPVIVTYPDNRNTWPRSRVLKLEADMQRQWKNVMLIPGETDTVKLSAMTDGAYASANAIGSSRMQIVSNLVTALSMHIQGSQYASNDGPGAYAKDKVADSARMYKAPGDASCYEAMLNRGFVKPLMLANRPTLEETLWPRFSIDASFAEDLDLLLRIMEAGVKMGAAIDTVTFSDRFKIPLATLPLEEGQTLLKAPAGPPAQFAPVDPDAAESEAIVTAEKAFSEAGSLVTIKMRDGRAVSFRPEQAVYTSNRGPVRASMLESGDVPELPESMVMRGA